jgi:hypothetical protein
MLFIQIIYIREDEDNLKTCASEFARPPMDNKPGKERSGMVRGECIYLEHGGEARSWDEYKGKCGAAALLLWISGCAS